MLGYYIFHLSGSLVMLILGCIIISKQDEIRISDIGQLILMMLFTWAGLIAIGLGYLCENNGKVLFIKDAEGKWKINNGK